MSKFIGKFNFLKGFLIFIIFSPVYSQDYLKGIIDSSHFDKTLAIKYFELALTNINENSEYNLENLEDIIKGYAYLGEFKRIKSILTNKKENHYENALHFGIAYYYPSHKLVEYIPKMTEFNFGFILEKFILEGKYEKAYSLTISKNTDNVTNRFLRLIRRYSNNYDTIKKYGILLNQYNKNVIADFEEYASRNNISIQEKRQWIFELTYRVQFDSNFIYQIRAYNELDKKNIDKFINNCKYLTNNYQYSQICYYLEANVHYFASLSFNDLQKLYKFFNDNTFIDKDPKYSYAFNIIRNMEFFINSMKLPPKELIQLINSRADKESFQSDILIYLAIKEKSKEVLTLLNDLTSENSNLKSVLLISLICIKDSVKFKEYYLAVLNENEKREFSFDLYDYMYDNFGYKEAEQLSSSLGMKLDKCKKEQIILEEYLRLRKITEVDAFLSTCLEKDDILYKSIQIARYYSGLPFSGGELAEFFFNYSIDELEKY